MDSSLRIDDSNKTCDKQRQAVCKLQEVRQSNLAQAQSLNSTVVYMTYLFQRRNGEIEIFEQTKKKNANYSETHTVRGEQSGDQIEQDLFQEHQDELQAARTPS